MNNLSWLLYLADVLDSFKIILILCNFGLIGCVLVAVIVYFSDRNSRMSYDPEVLFPKRVYGFILLLIIGGLITGLVPSKNTVYAIAASQFGEQVIKTPLATKAEKALESWLDKQIAVPLPAKKSSD